MNNNYNEYLKKIKSNKIKIYLYQISIFIIFLFIWQLLTDFKVIDSFIISSPRRIINTLISLYKSNNLFIHIYTTLIETIISFIISMIISIIVATLLWYFPRIYKIIDPYLTILNSLPKVALGPIIIIWFGAGIKSIIIMSLLISVIITIITVLDGFNKTDSNKIKLLKSFKATKSQIFFKLILPSNYKTIISALKINVSMCLIGVLPPVGEKIFFNKCYSRY